MARNAKAVIATAVVVLLSVLLVRADLVLVGVGVLVVGLLGVAALHQRDEDRTDEDADGQSKLDRALEERAGAAPEPTASAPAPSKGLPTWNGARPEPATDAFAPADTDLDAGVDEPVDDEWEARTGRSAWRTWDDLDRGPVAEEFHPDNPLADLGRLDEVDPVAEVERLEGIGAEAPSSTFSFSSARPPIDETAVQTDEDIMAASQATELHVEGSDSELARLLAKVQQRLAAYE